MSIKDRHVSKLRSSPAVQAAFPVVRDWLLAILTRGERASGTGKAGTRSSIRKGSATHQ